MSNSEPKTARVARGFVLHSASGGIVEVAFNTEHGLEIKQGDDFVLIATEDVEAFKKGMTWVNSDVLCAKQ